MKHDESGTAELGGGTERKMPKRAKYIFMVDPKSLTLLYYGITASLGDNETEKYFFYCFLNNQ